jgi:hypothetical protein
MEEHPTRFLDLPPAILDKLCDNGYDTIGKVELAIKDNRIASLGFRAPTVTRIKHAITQYKQDHSPQPQTTGQASPVSVTVNSPITVSANSTSAAQTTQTKGKGERRPWKIRAAWITFSATIIAALIALLGLYWTGKLTAAPHPRDTPIADSVEKSGAESDKPSEKASSKPPGDPAKSAQKQTEPPAKHDQLVGTAPLHLRDIVVPQSETLKFLTDNLELADGQWERIAADYVAARIRKPWPCTLVREEPEIAGDNRQALTVKLPGPFLAFCVLKRGPQINLQEFKKKKKRPMTLLPGALIQSIERKGLAHNRRVDFTIDYCAFEF